MAYKFNPFTGKLDEVGAGGGGSSAIVESGENTNGEYIRFSDGTQICWKSRGNGTWTFPAAFASTPVVTGTPGTTSLERFTRVGNETTTSCTTGVFQIGGSTGVGARWHAIGRWQ